MSSFPALDVALSLAFVYFLLSVVATAATELVAQARGWRSAMLERWVDDMLSGEGQTAGQAAQAFYRSPLIKALSISTRGRKQTGRPSYIPARHFVSAVLETGQDLRTARKSTGDVADAIRAQVEHGKLAATPAGKALATVFEHAEGDAKRFRHDAEAWFDDQMERLSGVYRRKSQWVVWAVSLALIIGLNANTVRMATSLYNDPAARSVAAAQASNASSKENPNQALEQLKATPLPLGWYGGAGYHFESLTSDYLYAPLGWLLTFFAVSLGAPFWFDTLSKLGRLRSTGSPPPATDATRRGDGDQERNATPPPPSA